MTTCDDLFHVDASFLRWHKVAKARWHEEQTHTETVQKNATIYTTAGPYTSKPKTL